MESKKKCKNCGEDKFDSSICSKKITCEDLRLLFNEGKGLKYEM